MPAGDLLSSSLEDYTLTVQLPTPERSHLREAPPPTTLSPCFFGSKNRYQVWLRVPLLTLGIADVAPNIQFLATRLNAMFSHCDHLDLVVVDRMPENT
uniref:Uncharacterized protein n=1 Tax=Oryza meridionalis TaxID=40149 RepID=A0A0E0FAK7_9ORYZ